MIHLGAKSLIGKLKTLFLDDVSEQMVYNINENIDDDVQFSMDLVRGGNITWDIRNALKDEFWDLDEEYFILSTST